MTANQEVQTRPCWNCVSGIYRNSWWGAVAHQDGCWAVPSRWRHSRFSITRTTTNTMRTFCNHRVLSSFCSSREVQAVTRISWWDKNWLNDLVYASKVFFKQVVETCVQGKQEQLTVTVRTSLCWQKNFRKWSQHVLHVSAWGFQLPPIVQEHAC